MKCLIQVRVFHRSICPHVFERFYVGREKKSEGSGLGLYIVQITVNELGGSIAVDSVVGKGTTFTICLPVTIKMLD